MRNNDLFVSLLLAVTCSSAALGCNQPPGYGFLIRSQFTDETKELPVITPQKNQELHGDWIVDDFGGTGSNVPFDGTTDNSGILTELGKASPATWKVKDVTGYCSVYDLYAVHGLPDYEILDLKASSTPQNHNCYRIGAAYNVSPANVYYDSQVTITLTYRSGSAADIENGNSDPNESPDTSDWGSFYIYDYYGSLVDSGSMTVLSSNSAQFTTWTGAAGQYAINVYDSSGAFYGDAMLTVSQCGSPPCQ